MKTVYCIKLQKESEALERAPYPGPLGQKILAQVSKAAWKDWITQQTMLINENHLVLSSPEARVFLERAMEKYFFEV